MPLLSVIIPVFNESKTIKQIIETINGVPIDKEIIVVDDGSFDGSNIVLKEIKLNNLKVIYHSSNRGKGAAVLTGLSNAEGEFVIIQDADLEYEPNDYLSLMRGIRESNADIAMGARFLKGYGKGLFMHRFGNWFLTELINFLFGVRLNDSYTCYKLLRRETLRKLDIKEQAFSIEPEIVIKAIRNKLNIKEVPISYYPRTHMQGKKIRVLDGVKGAISIIRLRFWGD